MYDAATALGEAATLADRVRSTSGDAVLVPEHLREGKRAVLENYCAGADLTVESYPMADGNADVDALADRAGDDVVMVYAENPTVRGCIEERLATIGGLAADADALFTLGSDPVSLSVLQEPASVGADVVVGEAGARAPDRLRDGARNLRLQRRVPPAGAGAARRRRRGRRGRPRVHAHAPDA